MNPNVEELRSSGEYHIWPFDFAFSSSLEIPTNQITPVLPHNLFPMEVRPGISLLNISVFDFTAESHTLTKSCVEIILGVHVLPHLGLAKDLPKMSVYLLQMGATTEEFLESPDAIDVQPFKEETLNVEIDRKVVSVECRDKNGGKIFSMQKQHDCPVYFHDLFYVQTFCKQGDTLYFGGVYLESNKFEHQKKSQPIGKFYNHSFFHGIDVENLDPTDSYIQTWSKPGSFGTEFYTPFKPFR